MSGTGAEHICLPRDEVKVATKLQADVGEDVGTVVGDPVETLLGSLRTLWTLTSFRSFAPFRYLAFLWSLGACGEKPFRGSKVPLREKRS